MISIFPIMPAKKAINIFNFNAYTAAAVDNTVRYGTILQMDETIRMSIGAFYN